MKAVVTIMMMSRVSAMSISGIRFMSAIGSSSAVMPRCKSDLRLLARWILEQRGEPCDMAMDVQDHSLNPPYQVVVCHDSRNGNEQTEGGRAQRLRDSIRHRLIAQPALAHGLEGSHHSDDRAEETDE